MEFLQNLSGENFLKAEINCITFIQNKFFPYEELLGHFSTVFGSTFLYLYLIPLIAAFNTKLYHRTLLACVSSDFLNLILKWIISEDRPYWWVFESKAYAGKVVPTLYQTERTCETSPGSPSGHMMMASCFVHLIYEEINFQIEKRGKFVLILKIFNRIALVTILSLTAISRMFFAAHFLHQCIFGCILGIFIAMVVSRGDLYEELSTLRKSMWLKIIIAMATLTTVIFWLHKLISGNPMASVQLAFKYCLDPHHPKPETTVVFSAIRSVALMCAFLVNAPIKNRESKLDARFSWILTLLLMAAQHFTISMTPKNYKIIVFYAYTFVFYALFQSLLMFLIPKWCSDERGEKHAKIKSN